LNHSANASTYYFVGDHDDGPLTITFDPDDFNPYYVTDPSDPSIWRTAELTLTVTNTSSTETYNDVKMVLPFVWFHYYSPAGYESYNWNDSIQRWENSNASYPGFDTSDILWLEVKNVPLDTSGSTTASPDLFITMNDIHNISTTSDEPISPSPLLPQVSVSETDSFPVWNVASALGVGDSASVTMYFQYERGIDGLWVEPKIIATPIPASLWIFGSGLIGILGIRRKFKK
jgi:hypothetical protein